MRGHTAIFCARASINCGYDACLNFYCYFYGIKPKKPEFMTRTKEESVRIQTSILNGIEKKVLVWLAERQPVWMTSDILTAIGTIGAIIIAAGFILAGTVDIHYLWLSSLGFVINWYGDSLDGTLARVRNRQRPLYGYYLDHTVDAINEVIMFVGAGLSGLVHIEIALSILVIYLLLTINVSVNAHLKREFCLTYAKMGPTEFRIIMIIINTVLIYVTPIREFSIALSVRGRDIVLSSLDAAAIVIFFILLLIYVITILKDVRDYDKLDPMP